LRVLSHTRTPTERGLLKTHPEPASRHDGQGTVPTLVWADDLPKTRSGKIMRRLLRDIAERRALGDVTTLRDPDVMAQLEGKIKEEQASES
jgi:acyl-CoA synthetase (AMP-forming)/AMP-acid ligase II